MKEQEHKYQVQKGDRFEFGKNWESYLNTLTEEKIEIAKQSLVEMLGFNDLTGKTFLDVGCGSGLFSLSAMKLGAIVYSLDFDPYSVKCTQFLREKYFPQSKWTVQEGSVLDRAYIESLGKFDIVYSWGVLHHTGNLQGALENIDIPVKEKGKLFISIYNDQGRMSIIWRRVKKIYNANFIGKTFIILIYLPYFILRGVLGDLLKFKNPLKRYKEYKTTRGMSLYHDWFDWLGGLPFEVASPQTIFDYYKKKNYSLEKLKTTNTLGCNEFVFQKNDFK
jgi:2-polyprenyl-6-hydroxyphenyl methylase/3-demethylubiquinone-9 3-methyltransferase